MHRFMIFTALFVFVSCFGQLDNGLVAFYPFDGNADDSSKNANHASVNGATLVNDRFGNEKSAYSFDGKNNFIEFANSPNLNNLDKKLTMSIWFNTNDYYSTGDKWAILLIKAGQSTALDSRQFSLYYRDNGDIYFNNDIIGNYPFKLDTWYNIALTYDLGSVKLYVNGEQIKTTAVKEIIKNDLSLIVGYDTPGAAEYYNGILDDIRIYDRILTEDEITELACDSCSNPLDKGLVAFYPFCGNVDDMSNNKIQTKINGATLVNDRFGNQKNAYSFNGKNNFIEIANSPNLNNLDKKLTMSIWFNTNDYYSTGAKWAILLIKAGQSTALDSRQFSLYYRDNGDIFFNNDIIGNYPFKLDTWYNITLTYDLGSVDLYVNGEQLQTTTVKEIVRNDLSLIVGYDTPGAAEYYNGILDDIRIYDRILTENEIASLISLEVNCGKLQVD